MSMTFEGGAVMEWQGASWFVDDQQEQVEIPMVGPAATCQEIDGAQLPLGSPRASGRLAAEAPATAASLWKTDVRSTPAVLLATREYVVVAAHTMIGAYDERGVEVGSWSGGGVSLDPYGTALSDGVVVMALQGHPVLVSVADDEATPLSGSQAVGGGLSRVRHFLWFGEAPVSVVYGAASGVQHGGAFAALTLHGKGPEGDYDALATLGLMDTYTVWAARDRWGASVAADGRVMKTDAALRLIAMTQVEMSPAGLAVGDDDHVFVTADTQRGPMLYRFDAQLQQVWAVPLSLQGPLGEQPLLVRPDGGMVIVGRGRVLAFDPGGRELWSWDRASDAGGFLTADGMVLTADGGDVVFVDPSGRPRKWAAVDFTITAPPLVTPWGRTYVAGADILAALSHGD
jgi:hypothetical protein